MARGLSGGRVDEVPAGLRTYLARAWAAPARSVSLLALAARLGHPGAEAEAVARLREGKLKDAEQNELLDLFGALATPDALPLLAASLKSEKNEVRRARRLATLGGYASPAAAEAVMDAYPALPARLQNTAQRMLSERPGWAAAMLPRLNLGTFNPGVLSSANAALIRGHGDPRLSSLLTTYQQKHSADPALQAAEKLFETGRTAYQLTCAPCHQETGSGLAMLAPALVGSRWLQAADEILVRIVLHGKENPGRGLIMPPWRQLDDTQLAATLTYVRREFGNVARPLVPATVAAVRAATSAREKAWTDAELDSLAAASR
jgi:mono/diheme cytochrome c family protein